MENPTDILFTFQLPKSAVITAQTRSRVSPPPLSCTREPENGVDNNLNFVIKQREVEANCWDKKLKAVQKKLRWVKGVIIFLW